MSPVILHVDMDAFFVSVEELYDPCLRGKPVIVGGKPNQRGVVAAASYAARRFGVHSAMPLARAARLCPQAVFLPVHRERYRAASQQIEEIFRQFSPRVEMVSVDEAYLNLTGSERLFGSPLRAAHLLHDEVARKARLHCSIGVSGNRLVSKIASDQAKPNGILWVMPGREAAFLAPLLIGKMPGIGKVTEKNLHRLGIRTLGDMERWRAQSALAEIESLSRRLGFPMSRMPTEESAPAQASEAEDGEAESQAKSVGHEETFAEDVSDAALLDSALADLSQRVAARLREQGLYACTITLKLRYASFQTLTRAKTLAGATNLDGVILETARRLFRKNWNRKRKVRLLGVQASGLSSRAGQGNLLTAAVEEKWSQVLDVADRIRERFGFSSVQLATALPPPELEAEPRTLPRKASPKNHAHDD